MDAGALIRMLLLREMQNAAENPLPTETWEDEEDENGISAE